MPNKEPYQTSFELDLRFKCLLTAGTTDGAGTGVGNISSSRLATVFVGLTCNDDEVIVFPLTVLAVVVVGPELARLSAEPPMAVGC